MSFTPGETVSDASSRTNSCMQLIPNGNPPSFSTQTSQSHDGQQCIPTRGSEAAQRSAPPSPISLVTTPVPRNGNAFLSTKNGECSRPTQHACDAISHSANSARLPSTGIRLQSGSCATLDLQPASQRRPSLTSSTEYPEPTAPNRSTSKQCLWQWL